MRPSSPAGWFAPVFLLSLALPLAGQDAELPVFEPAHVAALEWRGIGPTNMAGRITDLEMLPDRPATVYAATAGGGLWRTRNAGTTWEPLFQHQPVASLGDVAVARSNPDVVYVGTGEENARNSVSFGDGVYKSTDGGDTWQHTGLAETFQIGHIAIHPHTADTVYVAALGTLWGPNTERGVFRTKDGGKSWEKVLYIDEWTGCIDVRVDPQQPDIVYAAMYERARDEFDSNDPAVRFGEKAGFFKSIDGGDTWTHLTDGLPTCRWGRSALGVYEKDPSILYAMIETERSGWSTGDRKEAAGQRRVGARAYLGVSSEDGDDGARIARITKGGPADKSELKAGDTIVKIGETTISTRNELTSFLRSDKATPDGEVTMTIVRGGERKELAVTLGSRGGTTAPQRGNSPFGPGNGPFSGRLGGQQPNVQSEQGDNGFETGGIFRSEDHGQTWKRVNSLTERPFYYSVFAIDPNNDKNLYVCGVQFQKTDDGGETFKDATRGLHVDFHAVVVDPTDPDHILLAGDGGLNTTWDRCEHWEVTRNLRIGQFYHADVDNSVPYRIYGGLQDNGTWGGPSRTRNSAGIGYDDWVQIYGGDGFIAKVDPEHPHLVYATSQNGNVGQINMRTQGTARIARPSGGQVQFNWDTPFFLSPHNPRVLYLAGDHAIRHYVGAHENSPRAARAVRSEFLTEEPLGLTDRGTATAMAESPVRPGLLYVGTDDGALWRSKDNGMTWEELHAKLSGMPGPRYVSSIHPSRFDDERVYVTFDGHRSNDFDTHVYASDDAGDTWKSLAGNLPDEPSFVVREDHRNEDLLFLGTEFGCYASLDRGAHWLSLGTGLPTVAVRDLAIQDRDADLVAATHGRGIWIVDITPLRTMTEKLVKDTKVAHLFRPQDAILWRMRRDRPLGDKDWFAPNPPTGTTVYALFAKAPEERPIVTIHDITGQQVGTVTGTRDAGLQAFVWNTGRGQGRGRGRGGRFGSAAAPVKPGSFSARLKVGDRELAQAFRLLPDPDPGAAHPAAATSSTSPTPSPITPARSGARNPR